MNGGNDMSDTANVDEAEGTKIDDLIEFLNEYIREYSR